MLKGSRSEVLTQFHQAATHLQQEISELLAKIQYPSLEAFLESEEPAEQNTNFLETKLNSPETVLDEAQRHKLADQIEIRRAIVNKLNDMGSIVNADAEAGPISAAIGAPPETVVPTADMSDRLEGVLPTNTGDPATNSQLVSVENSIVSSPPTSVDLTGSVVEHAKESVSTLVGASADTPFALTSHVDVDGDPALTPTIIESALSITTLAPQANLTADVQNTETTHTQKEEPEISFPAAVAFDSSPPPVQEEAPSIFTDEAIQKIQAMLQTVTAPVVEARTRLRKGICSQFTLPELPVVPRENMNAGIRQYFEVYESVKTVIEKVPECAEKSIAILEKYFESQTLRAKSPELPELATFENIQSVFALLRIQVVNEYLNDKTVSQALDSIDQAMNAGSVNAEEIYRAFYNLLKYIEPINIDKMMSYVDNTLEAAQKLRDTDVCMLLGPTGCGKSTTLQLCGGSKMGQVKVGKLKHIDAIEISNPDLLSVKTSPFTRSETRSINPIRIDAPALGAQKAQPIVLCDSPGFDDTDGPEIDIANGIGIVRAVKMARSVRLAVLVSQKALGDRLEGIQRLGAILADFIPNVEQHLAAFTYVYTKFKDDQLDEIEGMIENAINGLSVEARSNKGFMSLINDMHKKAQDKILAIDPLRTSPGYVLDEIYESLPIENPEQHFSDFVTASSLSKLKEQLYKHKIAIERAVERVDIGLLEYKFSQLAQIRNKLGIHESQKMYDICIGSVEKLIQELLTQIESRIQICMDDGNAEIESDIVTCSNQMRNLVLLDSLRQEYLTNIPGLEAFCQTTILNAQLALYRKFHENMQKNDHLTMKMKLIYLNKMKSISDSFKVAFSEFELSPAFIEGLVNCYDSANDTVVQQYKQYIDKAEKSLESRDFNEFSASLDVMKCIEDEFWSHVGSEIIVRHYDNLVMSANNMLGAAAERALDALTELRNGNVVQLNTSVVIEAAKNLQDVYIIPGIEKHLDKSHLSQQSNQLDKAIIDGVSHVRINAISSQFSDMKKQPYHFAREWLEQIDQLRANKHLNYILAKPHSEIIQFVREKLIEDYSYCLDQVKSFGEYDLSVRRNIDYEKLVVQCKRLMDSLIFQGYPENVYQDELSNIHECLNDYLKRYHEFLTQIQLAMVSNKSVIIFANSVIEFFGIKPVLALLGFDTQCIEQLIQEKRGSIQQNYHEIQSILLKYPAEIEPNYLFDAISYLNDTAGYPDEELARQRSELVTEGLHRVENQNVIYQQNCHRVFDMVTSKDAQEDEVVHTIQRFVDSVGQYRMMIDHYNANTSVCDGRENIRELYKTMFDVFPKTLLEQFVINSEFGVMRYLQDMNSLVSAIETNSLDVDVYRIIKFATAFKAIDKFLPEGNSFLAMIAKIEGALRTQTLSRVNELRMLALSRQYAAFESLYRDTRDNMPAVMPELTSTIDDIYKTTQKDVQELGYRLEKLAINDSYADAFMDVMGMISLINCVFSVLELAQVSLDTSLKDRVKQSYEVIQGKFEAFLVLVNEAVAEHKYARFERACLTVGKMIEQISQQSDSESIDLLTTTLQPILTEMGEIRDFIINTRSNDYVNLPLSEYQKMPPVTYLNGLKEAVEYAPQYQDAHNHVSHQISTRIIEMLNKLEGDEVGAEELDNVKAISDITIYVTPEIFEQYKDRFKQIQESLEQREASLDRMLAENQTADKLRALVDSFEGAIAKRDRRSAIRISKVIQNLIYEVSNRFKADIDRGDLAVVLHNLPKSWEDWWYYRSKLKEYRKSLTEKEAVHFSSDFVNKTIDSMLEAITSQFRVVFSDIESHVETTKLDSYRIVNEHFDKIQALVELVHKSLLFKEGHPTSPDILDDLVNLQPTLIDNLVNAMNRFGDLFEHSQLLFITRLNSDSLNELRELLDSTKAFEGLIDRVKQFANSEPAKTRLPDFSQKAANVCDYKTMQKQFVGKLHALQDTINEPFLHNAKLKTTDFDILSQFYGELSHAYDLIISARQLSTHCIEGELSIRDMESQAKDKLTAEIQKLRAELETLGQRLPNTDYSVAAEFAIWLSNFRAIIETFKNTAITQEAEIQMRAAERQVEDHLKNIADTIPAIPDIETIAQQLIALKEVGIHIPKFTRRINLLIDSVLLAVSKIKDGQSKIATIGLSLRNRDDEKQDIAQRLINEHAAFKGIAIQIWIEKTSRFTINDVLRELRGDRVKTARLQDAFAKYEALYKSWVEKGLLKCDETKKLLVQEAYKCAQESGDKSDIVIRLAAYLFAFWTLINSEHYMDMIMHSQATGKAEDDSHSKYLLQPHPAQVISIFRLLGVDSAGITNLDNHLVQIGTGEGKSVTLAIVSSILGLLGNAVHCVCYSEYLSRRDFDAFNNLFEAFGISEHVQYGTFIELSDVILNEHGDIRQILSSVINGATSAGDASGAMAQSQQSHRHGQQKASSSAMRPRILLVDEVDVFFGKDFYGNAYSPVAPLQHQSIEALIKFIWNLHTSKTELTYAKVLESTEFRNCCTAYRDWTFLIEGAVKEMLGDLSSFESEGHQYVVVRGQVGYKDQDGITFRLRYGYKTTFAALKEYARSQINADALKSHLAIFVDAGLFSYAEMPRNYHKILGVTGTLESISQPEKEVLKEFNINTSTYMPSVYGSNQLIFSPDSSEDLKIESKSAHHLAVLTEIKKRLTVGADIKRAVIVVFEERQLLENFKNSELVATSGIKERIRYLTEQVPHEDKEGLIAQATLTGAVTLITREFGRGTDFKCYDERLNQSGGVHVILTFFPPTLSEEIQIKGRSARQGNLGSFSMILSDVGLAKLELTPEQIQRIRDSGRIYDGLNKARVACFEKEFPKSISEVSSYRVEHTAAMEFFETGLVPRNVPIISAYLQSRLNSRATGTPSSRTPKNYRTVVLMDATGSMGHFIDKAKQTVNSMFDRIWKVLSDAKVNAKVELQFVAYRNYDSGAEGILEYSGWHSTPDNLLSFVNRITAKEGTWAPEAVEIALWYLNQLAEQCTRQRSDNESSALKINQAILIGDAPANPVDLVHAGRAQHGGESYWAATKNFKSPTHIDVEILELIENNIPVHAFYLDPAAKDSFAHIANRTHGRTGHLDIDSAAGAEMLTDLVTQEVLRSMDDGERLVETYRKLYKGYTSGPGRHGLFGKGSGDSSMHERDSGGPSGEVKSPAPATP